MSNTGLDTRVGTDAPPEPRRDRATDPRYLFAGIAVGGIWVAVAIASIWSPQLVAGSEHDQVPIVAMSDWFYGVIATGLVLLAFSRRTSGASRSLWAGFTVAVCAIWVVAAISSVWAPELVAGSEGDRVPIASLVSPIAAVLATAFASVFVAGTPGDRAHDALV
jgi:hypothetical protein